MKSISRRKLFRILAFIFILLSFEAHGQAGGIKIHDPLIQRTNKVEAHSQQPNIANNPTKKKTSKSAKKSTKKVKKSKKKSSKSAKKSKTKAKNSKKNTSKSAKKSTKKVKKSKKKSSTNRSASNKSDAPPTFVYIDPNRDLGINKGYVCFRIKAYSNREISDFSKALCTYIKNSNEIKLTWESSSSKYVIGYHLYFGNSAKKTNNFITDVM